MKKYRNNLLRRPLAVFVSLVMLASVAFPINAFANEKLPVMGTSATSTVIASLGSSNLIDGDNNTFWSSNGRTTPTPVTPDSVALSLAGKVTVSSIVITTRVVDGVVLCFPSSFSLQYLSENKVWTTIPGQSYTNYSATTQNQVFELNEPLATSAIRVEATTYTKDDFNTYYFQLAEIMLYGEVVSPPGAPIWGSSPIPELYGYVSEGSFSGPDQPYSPDPLVKYRWDNPVASDSLEIYLRKPVTVDTQTPESFENIESITTDDVNVLVKGKGTIRMDFGAEFAGWLEIDSPDLAGSITLGMSEYNQPAFVNSGPMSPSKTKAPEKVGNTYRLKLNAEYYEGVRFGFINITSFTNEFHITGVRLVCQTKPVNYNGSFYCDNEMLNKIWYTAAYDVRLNLKQDYFAAILVDRGDRHSWTGDAYPAQAAALAAFANYDFVLDNLKYTAVRKNGIESYEMYWIFSLIDYYKYTGDKKGVNELLSQATERLDIAYNIYGKNPNLGFFGWDERLGAGFERPNMPDNQLSYKMLAIRAWSEFSDVLKDIGRDDLAVKYSTYAKEKTEQLLANPNWYDAFLLHSGSDAINAGIVPNNVQDILYNKYYTDRVNRLSYSPFNEYFILQAMAKMGKHDDAISSILDMFGGQIEYGGTTFFESYRPQWNDELGLNDPVPNNQSGYTSLAHPWGAGVLTWMSEQILGISPTKAGFKQFSVMPHLGRQLNRVSGVMPTPYGDISFSFNGETGVGNLVVPEGTEALLAIPKLEKSITGITINGAEITEFDEDNDFVYISKSLIPGSYEIKVSYEGKTPSFVQSDYVYAAEYVGIDDQTKGNWVGKYGDDGYVLCAYNSSDVRRLPSYVDSIKYSKQKSATWTTSTTDERALQQPDTIGPRALGCLYTNDPVACEQTFTVDINLKEDKEYTVSLYFADYTREGRQVAIEMFDGETLDMIAPVKILTDYTGGKYVTYKYDKSARFRIDHVRGPNVTLSGIFFDEGGSENLPQEDETVYIDDRNTGVTYSGAWTHDPMPGCYNSTFSYSNAVGNYAEYTFKGTSISFMSSKESNRGIANIYFDGQFDRIVDLYSPNAIRQGAVYTKDGLNPNETHTIKVEVTGTKNPSANGAYIDIDAFVLKRPVKPFSITASAGVGGSISPSGITEAESGTKKTFTIIPDENYKIADVVVNGVSMGAVSSYTFYNIMRDYTITATFVPQINVVVVTPNLVGGCAAYVKVMADVENVDGFTAELFGETAVFEDGQAIIKLPADKVPNVTVKTEYDINININGAKELSCPVYVVPNNADIWTMKPVMNYSGKLELRFNSRIVPDRDKLVVKIAGVVYDYVQVDKAGRTILVIDCEPNIDDVIEVKGLKLADLFQSYSFAVTLTATFIPHIDVVVATPNLAGGCAAYVKVVVEEDVDGEVNDEGLTAELFGETAVFENGQAIIKLPAEKVPDVTEKTKYEINVYMNGAKELSCPIYVVPNKADIWGMTPVMNDSGKLELRFNSRVVPDGDKFAVKIAGVAYNYVRRNEADRTILVIDCQPNINDVIEVKDVKLSDLFQSYLFELATEYK